MASRRRVLARLRSVALQTGGACLLAASAAALSGCIQDDGTRFNPIRGLITSVSDDDERQLGMEVDREIQKHVEVIDDPVAAGFISDLGQELVRQIEPQPFIYRFRIINDDSLNAFAVPGGYIYLHSGTVMAVTSIDELAGVMSHEIGHVKRRHFARMKKKSQLPDLVAGIVGMAAAMAAREPGLLAVSQGVNVAMQLRFSREFENEADQSGAIFMTRAGHDALGMKRFFERILEEQKRYPTIPLPYLSTHPEVEDRIAAIEIAAEKLRPTHEPAPAIEAELPAVQARLALLMDTKRASLPSYAPPADRASTDPAIAEADRLAEQGLVDQALARLARAEAVEAYDPRVSFRIGELLYEQGRYQEAVAAFRRTVWLDPSRANVFYKLGLAYRDAGDRHRAVYAFEQALRRAGDSSALRRHADWEIEKLTFTIVPEAGFADGSDARDADTPVGSSLTTYDAGVRRMAWWARLGEHFVPYAREITVRWCDPSGRVVEEKPAERYRKPYIGSVLEFGDAGAHPAGEWTVEARLEGDVIDRRTVQVRQ